MKAFKRDEGDLTFHVTDDGLFVNLTHLGSGIGITIDVDEAAELRDALDEMIPKLPKIKRATDPLIQRKAAKAAKGGKR
jgi:hypothetical protein